MGMVVDKETMVDLSSKAGLKIEPGSIVIPLEETKGKMSALVIGNAQNIVDDGKQKVAERLEGVSTVLIPKKEFKSLSKDYVSQQLANIDLQSLELPSLDQLQQYVGLLATNFGSFVERLSNKLTEIDLSSYGITESENGTEVNLPGIYVNDTKDGTVVRIAGLRVNDFGDTTTVRIGNTLTVVDLPKMSFVSLPGITVMDVNGHGTAVSILGFKISDGIPADKLDEFREVILGQLDRWETGIDAELGRFLADKSASGLLSVGWDGEFNLLLDSKNKTLGNHIALESANKKGMHFLPPNFDEEMEKKTDDDIKFIELTGLDPTPGPKKKPKPSKPKALPKGGKVNVDISVGKEKKPADKKYDFDNIIDVELEEDEN
jgi:hypothetical protein